MEHWITVLTFLRTGFSVEPVEYLMHDRKGTIYRKLVELVIKEWEQYMVDQYLKENYCDFKGHSKFRNGSKQSNCQNAHSLVRNCGWVKTKYQSKCS